MRTQSELKFEPDLVDQSLPRRFLKRFPTRNIDRVLVLSVLALSIIGIIMIYCATRADTPSTYYLKRQLVFFILALLFMVLCAGFDYRRIIPYSKFIYVATLFLLLLTFVFPARSGAHRWMSIGIFDFQPSEIAKLVTIIMLATFIADHNMDMSDNREFLKALGIALVPMVLIFLEPDLGIAISIFVIFVGMALVGGARLKQIAVLGLATIATVVAGIELHLLKGYQLERLLVFIKSDIDPYGAGYNLLQSKIAIGSGRLFGRGIFQGTQTNLKFIPEHHTDFIFSVVGEELGFIGAALILFLFGLLLWRLLRIASGARDSFGTMLATGVIIMFFFQVLVNTGMTLGIMPVAGITLPFLSYGGSSLIVSFMCVGLILNIGMRKFPQDVQS
ncbi:MAG: rod shape-determining protein RodA [Actinomycetota bacterium]|nr:rod shape-determining protein RodA [Actinomycetota bacterium]